MASDDVEPDGKDARAAGTKACHVIHHRGSDRIHFSREAVEELLADGGFFWLDLDQPDDADFAILLDVFEFHPLAVEDSEHFGQRAKIDEYDDHVFLVLYGASPDDDRLVEVHCFYSERHLVTVHRDEAPAFSEVRDRFAKRGTPLDQPARLLYQIVHALTDSFFPILADFDDRIDELEDQTFLNASDAQLQEIFRMKRLLVGLRKAVTPERDMFARVAGGISTLPGMTPEDERYFRDIYDHLIRISDLVDTYRDLLTSSMDVYLSTVSNRLNGVVKQLTIIATIFLPLSWLTGFFGQNFGWEVHHISGWASFALLGFGTEIVALAALLVFFKRRGWF
ncbi:MAG TPA: magnesium/cobalt transporter CorA [Gaiellaceae bacterium]|nr:magnesium/cobalt transporter CorA [Gaiellaceae bacterium]